MDWNNRAIIMQSNTPKFFALPTELRQQIFSFVFIAPAETDRNSKAAQKSQSLWHKWPRPIDCDRWNMHAFTGVLRVCRRFYQEAREVFFRQIWFNFQLGSFPRYDAFFSSIESAASGWIRHIDVELEIPITDYLARISHNKLLDLRRKLPALREVRLTFGCHCNEYPRLQYDKITAVNRIIFLASPWKGVKVLVFLRRLCHASFCQEMIQECARSIDSGE